MITLFVKHDTLHHSWHKLTVGFKDQCINDMDKLTGTCYEHAMQYAIDNQMNRDLMSFWIVDKNLATIFEYESNAIVNSRRGGNTHQPSFRCI